jgi:GNAT superfamily N-acetyltransferase
MARVEQRARLVSVTDENSDTVSVFLHLGRNYLSSLPSGERERFLQSILKRRGEADRWLFLMKHANEYIGFVHMKIDKDERPGWGFILEFYIVPDRRKMGWGRRFFHLIMKVFKARHVQQMWLLTDQAAEPFWHALGFRDTGARDKETGQRTLERSTASMA